MDIDLVYLWVDGSDPVWRAKRNEFLHDADIAVISHEATDEARFRSLDELKFSLRSVEKYAPWIRHIYIVTDFIVLCHCVDKLFSYSFGVIVMNTYPFNAVNLCKLIKQICK